MSIFTTTNTLGYNQTVVSSMPTRLTLPDPFYKGIFKATRVLIHCEGNLVRYRDDGIDPTATEGMFIIPFGQLMFDGDLKRISFIAGTAQGYVVNSELTTIINYTFYA